MRRTLLIISTFLVCGCTGTLPNKDCQSAVSSGIGTQDELQDCAARGFKQDPLIPPSSAKMAAQK